MLIDLGKFIRENQLTVNAILHVGAHLCEERDRYHRLGVEDDSIVWVEANHKLVKANQQRDSRIKIHNFAVSDTEEVVKFNITNNGESSSLLQLDKHAEYYPEIVVVEEIRVKTTRLDTIISCHPDFKLFTQPPPPRTVNLINLDIQGVELRALKGLGRYLEFFDLIYTEVNDQTLYKECDQIGDIDAFLEGFERKVTQMTPKHWGDAIYLRVRGREIRKNAKVAAHITGGLGNQLFILAHLLAYCWKYECTPVYDPRYVNNLHTKDEIWRKCPRLRDLIPMKYVDNPDILHESPPAPTSNEILLEGYFQTEKYFYGFGDKIRELFRQCFDEIVPPSVEQGDVVGVHVRRGDYLGLSHIFHILDREYYERAQTLFPPNSKYLVISQDLDWSRENLNFLQPEYSSESLYEDFVSLMRCEVGLIISNSTFSWWAAYLSSCPLVVFPYEWFTRKDRIHSIQNGAYYVDSLDREWAAVSTTDPKTFPSIVFQGPNQNLERGVATTRMITGRSYYRRPPKWTHQEYINFLTAAIAVMWYSDNKAEAHHIARTLHSLIKDEDDGVILPSTYFNLKFILSPEDFYQTIDLSQIPTYVIARPERHPEMTRRFEEVGLTPIFSPSVKRSNPIMGILNAHLAAITTALEKDVFPCVIFEDDVKFTPKFDTQITIPRLTQGYFLGLSKWGTRPLMNSGIGLKVTKLEANVYQVRNMLGGHGIMYVTREWAQKVVEYVRACELFEAPCDFGFAQIQTRSFVFAPNRPYVIQDATLNGQEEQTTLELETCRKIS